VMFLHSESRNKLYSSRGGARLWFKFFPRTVASNVIKKKNKKMSVVTVPVRLTNTRSSRSALDYGISWHSNFFKIKPHIKFLYEDVYEDKQLDHKQLTIIMNKL
jgi:hypothetical protein